MGHARSGRRAKTARRLGAHLAFLDERGVLRLPTRRRTWAPTGQSPISPSRSKHERLSALAALTVSPKRQPLGLYLRFPAQTFQAIDVAECRRARLRHLRGPVALLWDRGSIHRGPAIEAVCRADPRLHLEEFPASAPALHPTEHVGNNFKGHTAHRLVQDTRQICRSLQANMRRVRRSQDKLRSFILASKLPSPP
jgi:hypothetical protein